MSRSWKKTPGYTGSPGNYKRFAKREASAIVRRTRGVQDGAWYRRLYQLRWTIYDCVTLYFGGRREVLRRDERWAAQAEFLGYVWFNKYPPRPWKAWTK